MDETESVGSRELTMGRESDDDTETVTFAEWRAERPFWPGVVLILGVGSLSRGPRSDSPSRRR
jgi:hypothetical protein